MNLMNKNEIIRTSFKNTSYIPLIPIGTLESHKRKMTFISLIVDESIWNFRWQLVQLIPFQFKGSLVKKKYAKISDLIDN